MEQFSKINESYWYGNARYQREYEFLYDHFELGTKIPQTVHAKLLKILVVLLEEYHENNNENTIELIDPPIDTKCKYCRATGFTNQAIGEICKECKGSGYSINILDPKYRRVKPYYEYMLRFIDSHLSESVEVTLAIRDQFMSPFQSHSILESVKYTILGDLIMNHIINSKDKELEKDAPLN